MRIENSNNQGVYMSVCEGLGYISIVNRDKEM
jgi:hypothetical protein